MDDDPIDDPRPDGPQPWDLDASPVGRVLMPPAPPPAEGVDWAEYPLRADPLYAAFAVLPMVWFAVLSITMLRDPRGRGWQDKAAGSVVVRRSGPPS